MRNKREKTREQTQKDECPLIGELTPECTLLQERRAFSKEQGDSLLKCLGFHPTLVWQTAQGEFN